SFETPSISTEDDEQSSSKLFDRIKTNEYLVFVSFEAFLDHLYNEKIIESGRINHYSKNKRLKSILGFLDAHIGSYFNIYNNGERYFRENDTFDLREHRSLSYENDFTVWFWIVNIICEQFNIKYLWTFTDLENYFVNNLAF
ncbi:3178_t:CDS:1, partial [Gigaspora margarita]